MIAVSSGTLPGARSVTPSWAVLGPLWALDAVFVALSLALRLGVLADPRFSLGYDSGFAELAQYAKEAVALGAVAVVYGRRREPVYPAIAAVIAGLLLDDATRYHEVAGAWLAGALGLPGLRAEDLGEVLAIASWAVPVGFAGVWAYGRSRRLARRHAQAFALAVVVLAGFGVVLDAVHQVFQDVWGLSFALEALEEGGELATMSVIVAGAVALARRPPEAQRAARQDAERSAADLAAARRRSRPRRSGRSRTRGKSSGPP